MAEITLERLEEIGRECRSYRDLKAQIRSSYNTYRSPDFKEHSKGTEVSDPTVSAFHRIDQLKKQLQDHQTVICEFLQDLRTIDDPEIVTIIIWHYLVGLTWSDTCKKMTGKCDKRQSMKKVFYYLRTHNSMK